MNNNFPRGANNLSAIAFCRATGRRPIWRAVLLNPILPRLVHRRTKRPVFKQNEVETFYLFEPLWSDLDARKKVVESYTAKQADNTLYLKKRQPHVAAEQSGKPPSA